MDQVGDRLLEIGIVAGERQRRPILDERFGERAAPVVDFGEPPDGREVL